MVEIKLMPGYVYEFFCSNCKRYRMLNLSHRCKCGSMPSVKRKKMVKEDFNFKNSI
jgi:hypothetical protein